MMCYDYSLNGLPNILDFMNAFQIMDCTLRDGGYYTNWDFESSIVETYIDSVNQLPIDYIEVGYRNLPEKEYMGEFGYSPVYTLERIREKSSRRIAVMINEKSVRVGDLPDLLGSIKGLVDMVRMAVSPDNFERAVELGKEIKNMGFEVAFNLMYMSKWNQYDRLYEKMPSLNDVATILNMVDSFGSMMPGQVRSTIERLKGILSCRLGFHGHNNLQMGLANTLTAIECGIDSVDATVLGMGRGAGNLNTELLLTALNKQGMDVDFNVLGDLISAFRPLLDEYRWGTSLPYMISGANSIPQKEVMAMVTNRVYSFNNIVRAVDNKRNHVVDNAHFPLLEVSSCEEVLIIGGGQSVSAHIKAIKRYLLIHPNVVVIFATTRHAALFEDITNKKYYVLVGSEAKRMLRTVPEDSYCGSCVLPPYPRLMGTDVPFYAQKSTFELPEISFIDRYADSCTTVALQIAIEFQAQRVNIVGYDGYRGQMLSDKELTLTNENRELFESFTKHVGTLYALTPTLFNDLKSESIYQLI